MLQVCPVVGIYNKTDSKWTDLGQCITDKATFGSVNPLPVGKNRRYDAWKAAVGPVHSAVGGTAKLQAFIYRILAGNRAAQMLYAYLASLGAAERKTV